MTGLTTNNGKSFADTTSLQLQNLKAGTVARLITGERYAILVSDLGSGLVLPNGNFANLLSDNVVELITATTLVPGVEYLSTTTATHTVPAASTLNRNIKITWLDGTIMTLTSASNISVTTDAKVTDTTWVFQNFIQDLSLVDTGTEWEIK